MPMTLEELNEEAAKFIGDQMQMPPMVSAIKKDGVPLYKLARKGIEVEREPRLIHVYNFRFTEYAEPFGKFSVACTQRHLRAQHRARSRPETRLRCAPDDAAAQCIREIRRGRRAAAGSYFETDAGGIGKTRLPFLKLATGNGVSAERRHPTKSCGTLPRCRYNFPMNLIHAANDLQSGSRKVCLAIGVFDGVHLGHQQIIRQTVADAHQPMTCRLVVTFDRHPNAVVAPDRVPAQIFSDSQKLRAVESLGVDALLEIRFDQAFSEKTGEAFIRELARDFGKIHSVSVGADFVFGHRRTGNVTLLKKLGA